MAIFDDFDWNAWAPVAANVGGAIISSAANSNAAKSYQAGQQANIAAQTAGRDQAIATNQATADLANSRAAPAIQQMKTTLSKDPNQLTPQQQVGMNDARRLAINNISPGLRGSGRATAAINDDLTNRTKANYVAQNTQAQTHAADTLNQNAAAGYAANNNTASLQANTGNNVGKAMADTGTVNANADTANGNVAGSTLGAIGSIVANSNKDATRNTRYQNFKAQAEA